MAVKLSVIVAVCNEEIALRETASCLQTATRGMEAEIIYALNGTTDRSAEVITGVFGQDAKILSLPHPGKTAALDAADREATQFPRVYLDADICPAGDALIALLAPILDGRADLAAAPLQAKQDPRASWAARAVGRIWTSLPYARTQSFQCFVAISRQGRSNWGRWPNLLADDLFLAHQVPQHRRLIVDGPKTVMPLPQDLRTWIGVRTRWLRGQQQIRALGLAEGSPGHGSALFRMLGNPRNWVPIGLFLFVRLAATLRAKQQGETETWFRDETTRKGHFECPK